MLGMAAWAFSFVTVHYGRSGILWVGAFLVCLALAAWIFGEFIQKGAKNRVLGWSLFAATLIAGYGFGLEYQLDWRHPRPPATSSFAHGSVNQDGIEWEPWSPEAIERARSEGRPVLVDFTADWCLICQGNKASSLEIKSVREKLKDINAVALLADYTLQQPEITAELNRFERAGVPLVLVYPRKASLPPKVLPAVLTPAIVLSALEKAAE